jgi:negative regulator of sigma E activity
VDAHKTNIVLELIHSNICETNEHTQTRYKYFLVFIDDHSHHTKFYLLKHKYENFETFQIYKLEVENQFNKKLKSYEMIMERI